MEVIAERELTLRSNASESEVKVLIGRPYRESDGTHFCPFHIVGLGPERRRRAGGVDSIQSLQLALVMIGAELSAYSDSLRWEQSPSFGFPKSVHDPVIGDAE